MATFSYTFLHGRLTDWIHIHRWGQIRLFPSTNSELEAVPEDFPLEIVNASNGTTTTSSTEEHRRGSTADVTEGNAGDCCEPPICEDQRFAHFRNAYQLCDKLCAHAKVQFRLDIAPSDSATVDPSWKVLDNPHPPVQKATAQQRRELRDACLVAVFRLSQLCRESVRLIIGLPPIIEPNMTGLEPQLENLGLNS